MSTAITGGTVASGALVLGALDWTGSPSVLEGGSSGSSSESAGAMVESETVEGDGVLMPGAVVAEGNDPGVGERAGDDGAGVVAEVGGEPDDELFETTPNISLAPRASPAQVHTSYDDEVSRSLMPLASHAN